MRSSSTSHSLILDVHCSDRRAQRRPVGTRSDGTFPNSTPISSSVSPTRCAKTMNAIRLSAARSSAGDPSLLARIRVSPQSS